LKKNEKQTKEYIDKLEEKIVDLSFQLRNSKKDLTFRNQVNRKIMSKIIHNLKNPIGVVFSFSQIMLETPSEYTEDKLKKHSQIIHNSAAFSLEFLDSLAKYTSLYSIPLTLTMSHENFTKILKDVVESLTETAKAKNIKIKTTVPKNEIFINVNASEISQAIRNIVQNAIRFSDNNTQINIELAENKNDIITKITDEGMGILEKDLPFIFDEFFVVNTYSEDKRKCIGLGLPIAKKIIELHQGKTTVKSVIKQGTTVEVSIPKS
jgi:K+-sensing histidine kinase KdpD